MFTAFFILELVSKKVILKVIHLMTYSEKFRIIFAKAVAVIVLAYFYISV